MEEKELWEMWDLEGGFGKKVVRHFFAKIVPSRGDDASVCQMLILVGNLADLPGAERAKDFPGSCSKKQRIFGHRSLRLLGTCC